MNPFLATNGLFPTTNCWFADLPHVEWCLSPIQSIGISRTIESLDPSGRYVEAADRDCKPYSEVWHDSARRPADRKCCYSVHRKTRTNEERWPLNYWTACGSVQLSNALLLIPPSQQGIKPLSFLDLFPSSNRNWQSYSSASNTRVSNSSIWPFRPLLHGGGTRFDA